jgi:hypothetical protein
MKCGDHILLPVSFRSQGNDPGPYQSWASMHEAVVAHRHIHHVAKRHSTYLCEGRRYCGVGPKPCSAGRYLLFRQVWRVLGFSRPTDSSRRLLSRSAYCPLAIEDGGRNQSPGVVDMVQPFQSAAKKAVWVAGNCVSDRSEDEGKKCG